MARLASGDEGRVARVLAGPPYLSEARESRAGRVAMVGSGDHEHDDDLRTRRRLDEAAELMNAPCVRCGHNTLLGDEGLCIFCTPIPGEPDAPVRSRVEWEPAWFVCEPTMGNRWEQHEGRSPLDILLD